MRIQRLIGLICVLADVDKITVQELADRFEVSKRTIFRDLDTLFLQKAYRYQSDCLKINLYGSTNLFSLEFLDTYSSKAQRYKSCIGV
mgnify:CR=1 FL=1